ncbi:MAG: hypothetical protein HS111_32325 [Kofleriaceae bacterium]|nr:hypothetical protein [Kofleriaceae bacterium]
MRWSRPISIAMNAKPTRPKQTSVSTLSPAGSGERAPPPRTARVTSGRTMKTIDSASTEPSDTMIHSAGSLIFVDGLNRSPRRLK